MKDHWGRDLVSNWPCGLLIATETAIKLKKVVRHRQGLKNDYRGSEKIKLVGVIQEICDRLFGMKGGAYEATAYFFF